MRKRLRLGVRNALCAGLLAAMLDPTARAAEESGSNRARRVDAIFANLNRAPSPGLAIAVVRDGKLLLRRGYGLANLEHRVPVTPATVFDAASLAKPFTGLAIAMLAAEGKIDREVDVRRYLPELHDFGRPMTIEELLHHTSGLRDWPGALSIAGRRFNDSITLSQVLEFAFRQRSLNFAPGAEHLYSNTGYNLLAEVVRRVTGESFASWVDRRIFRPLRMKRTRVLGDATEVIPGRAYGYAREADGRWSATPDSLAAPGSSSLFTTVEDMALWLDNFRTGSVGGVKTLEGMLAPARLNDGTPVRYGLGLLTGSYRGARMFTHSGGWASFNSYFVYFPGKNFGVVVLANGDTPELDAQNAVIRVTDIYLGDDLDPKTTDTAEPRSPAAVAASSSRVDELAGLYDFGRGKYVRIARRGTELTARTGLEKATPLRAISSDAFRSADGSSVVFRRDAGDRVVSLAYGDDVGDRVDDRPPSTDALGGYVGDYLSDELGATFSVARTKDGLELRQRWRPALPLVPFSGDNFGTSDSYLASIQFQRSPDGLISGFLVNGDPRNRDIRFVRR